MKIKKLVIRAVLVVTSLPVVLPLLAGLFYYAMMSAYAPNHITGTIFSSGQRREYLLYVPPTYARAKPVPLVISLHPAALWPAVQQEASGWNTLADSQGFIVVYPSGTTLSGSGSGALPFRVWLMEPDSLLLADVRFISELIDTLESHYNIDATRIYANGFSNGGGMVFGLSCALSPRIAAVGAVSAAQVLPSSWCKDTTPVPMIAFHGRGDRFVPYSGAPPGWLNPRPFPDVVTWAAEWARRNRCGSDPVDSMVAADVTRREYRHCAGNASVLLYTIAAGGHAWPGGKPLPAWLVGCTSRSIDATRLMWAFFQEHPLRRNRS